MSESLSVKMQRLQAALNAGFPQPTVLLLLSELMLAMGEEQVRIGHLIASDMDEFRKGMERLTALAQGLKL